MSSSLITQLNIRKTLTPLLIGRLPFFETMKIEETQKLILLKNGVFVALLEWQVNYTQVLRLLWTLYSSVLGKGSFFNYVEQILPCIDHLHTASWHCRRNCFTVIRNLFMSFCTIFLYIILGWNQNTLGWKYCLLFNWEKNLFGTNRKFVYLIFIMISPQNNVWKYHTKGHEQV